MTRRIIASALLFAGLLLCAAAGYSYFTPPAGPGLVIENPDIDAGECSSGREMKVVIRCQNNTGHPIRVVGSFPC